MATVVYFSFAEKIHGFFVKAKALAFSSYVMNNECRKNNVVTPNGQDFLF
jgi:hypothetical protein